MNKKDISLKYYAYYMLKTECFLKGYIAKCLMSPLEMCMKPVNAAGKLRNKSLLKMDKAVTIFLPDCRLNGSVVPVSSAYRWKR